MPKLQFEDFISCFRKQFVFQVGHGGRRTSKYYVDQNSERGLKNDQWAIMAFIYTGTLYGFSDEQMFNELKISRSLYEFLKEEAVNVISPDYPDKLLNKNVRCKIGLVRNVIHYKHGIKLSRQKIIIDTEDIELVFLYKKIIVNCAANELLDVCNNYLK